MSSIASQFSAGVAQVMKALAVPAIYTRLATGESLSVNVAMAAPDYQAAAAADVLLLAEAWEVLIDASAIVISGEVHEPEPGDTIAVSAGGTTTTYTVMMPGGSQYCWTWADRFMARRRLFAKVT